MSDRTFLDTNVLVYLFDQSAPAKQRLAQSILTELADSIVISTQVLVEFYVVATRKLKKPLPARDAERHVQSFSTLDVVLIEVELVWLAVALASEHRLSLWDALIVECARARGCRRLLTEDLQHGREFGIVRVENPFR